MDNWQRQHQWSHYSSEEAQQPSQRGAPPTATNPTSTKPPPSIGMLPSGPPPPRGPPPSMVPLPSGPPIPKGPNSTMSNPPSEGVQQSGHPQQMIPPPSGPPPPIGFNPSGPPPPIGFNQSGPPPPIRFNPLRPPPPMGFNPSRPPPTSGFPPPGMEFPQPPYGYPPPPVWGMPPPHRDSNHSFKRKADPPVPPHPGSQFTSNFGQHTNTGPSIEARGPFHAPQPGIASSYRHQQGAPQVPAHREQNGQDQQLIISKMDLSDSPTSKFEKILTEDQQWLQDWLAKRGTSSKTDVKSKEKVSSTARTMTIPEARRLMREAVQLTEQMETIQDELHDIMSDPSDRWQHQYENVCHMKNRLNEIKELMEQENTIEMLVKQMKKAHKKRAHIKRCREERARKLREAEEEREQAHVRADQWLAALTKKQLDVIKEKEMKAGADAILGEVRRKIQEATKARNVLQSLTKLRQLRKVAEEKRGMHTSKESDDQFSAETAKLTEIITQQLDIYNTEKNALQVILDMEQEETMEKEKQHQQQREKVLLSRKTKQLSRLLFGYADDLQDDDPLLPFRQFYESAQHNIQSLLQIRHEWDQYLVPENTAGGSTIPAGWVAPSHPTNHVWATALADNQQKS